MKDHFPSKSLMIIGAASLSIAVIIQTVLQAYYHANVGNFNSTQYEINCTAIFVVASLEIIAGIILGVLAEVRG